MDKEQCWLIGKIGSIWMVKFPEQLVLEVPRLELPIFLISTRKKGSLKSKDWKSEQYIIYKKEREPLTQMIENQNKSV